MTVQPIARMIGEAFNKPCAGLEIPTVPVRRRKKLWDLPARWHCALLGTCLPPGEMRRLAGRAGLDEPDLSDYMLHARVVAQCVSRTEIAELIQRQFDQRYAQAVRNFGKAGDAAEVSVLWREALAKGELGGALWAAWSHPAVDEDDGGDEIYGELHMLSHKVCARDSISPQRLAAEEQKSARLREELAALHASGSKERKEHKRQTTELARRLTDAQRRLAQQVHETAALGRATTALESQAEQERQCASLGARIRDLERDNAALLRQLGEQVADLTKVRFELAAATAALEAALEPELEGSGALQDRQDVPAILTPLAGRSILCVGGRTRLIDRYRRVVEASGGRFSHHDGGQEESLHRIDAIVAGVDIVLCQSGFVSHAAYWRIKDICKRRNLPCVFLKSAGVTSFARILEAASAEVEARL